MEKRQKRRIPLPLLLFFILIAVTLLLCGTVLAIVLQGRSALRDHPAPPPAVAGTGAPQPEGYTVQHGGKYYRYREGMVNLLLLGVDGDTKPDAPLPPGEGGQADVILLAALDTDRGRMTLISLNRDTMCDLALPAEDGVAHAQLALSYAYGDGLGESCSLTAEAVSALFGGLEIDGYAAFFMGGIEELNDALGGVPVTILGDYPFSVMGPEGRAMTPGKEMTLSGAQARFYLQARWEDADGNAERMQRQKQYLLSALTRARQMLAKNPAKILPLYQSLSSYLLTDLGLSEITYLATQAAGMDFDGDIRHVEGELALGAGSHMELTVDRDALTGLILDVFYEEVAPPDTPADGG